MPAGGLAESAAAAIGQRGSARGSVVLQPGVALRLPAIVHHVDHEPDWHEAWVVRAWHSVLCEAARRALPELAVPLPDTLHRRRATLWPDYPEAGVAARLRAAIASARKT